mgnify:CR=1 FL=1
MKLEDVQKQVELDMKRRETNTKIYYLDRMVEEMQRGYFCVFAGAGLSAASGYVDWKTLLEPMGRQLGLNMNMDLTLLAQYYENEFTRDELNRRILDEFAKIPKSNTNMEILASMPICRYWTTNYDSVIEDTLKEQGKVVDVVTDQLQFKYHSPGRDAVVLKMHGDKTLPDRAVLCKNDYETYDDDRAIFTQSLTLDLISNTFLFIGFSFSDPNLDRIIAIVKRNFKEASLKEHYCFLRSINLKDYIKNKNENEYDKAKEQFEQDRSAQACKIRDMRRYGIETILVDDFNQITHMLKYMREKIKLSSVFVSGGIDSNNSDSYGSFQDKKEGKLGKAENFIMQLADRLILKQYNLVTGFGVGVGNYIVAGAYKRGEGKKANKLDERIYIQPMISIDDDLDMKKKIREELLAKCGIVITIFGKSVENTDKEKLEEDGTYIEYKIAKDDGKVIIPVGATGFTSKIIYEKEKSEWESNEALYCILGDEKKDNDTLVNSIIEGIEYKKSKQEEYMRKVLMKDLFELSEKKKNLKKVFLSFHYDSCSIYVDKVIDIILKSEKYWMSRELEKCEGDKIQQWIDDKLKDASITIIMFNKEFSNSKWTDYEVQMSIKKRIPFLFLIKKEEYVEEELETYIKQKEIGQYGKLLWENENDFEKIPLELNALLN